MTEKIAVKLQNHEYFAEVGTKWNEEEHGKQKLNAHFVCWFVIHIQRNWRRRISCIRRSFIRLEILRTIKIG